MTNILDRIIANTKIEVDDRRGRLSLRDLEKMPYYERKTYSFSEFLVREDKSGIIAEIKKQSPSKGVINDEIQVPEVGLGYERAGASAISVLTDYTFFGGKLDYLTLVRELVEIPVLRKDFIVDEYQVHEAKAIGADVILLIAACLTREEIQNLGGLAQQLDMEVLLEVHNEEELEKSICEEINVIGVNNRNLKTFDVSIETSLDLADKIPNNFVKVSESGLADAATIHKLKGAGYRGFLIGETFMKTPNPPQALKNFITSIEEYNA